MPPFLMLLALGAYSLVDRSAAADPECWVSGCQPSDWAKRGCFPDDTWRVDGAPIPCPGGDKYKCCKKDASEIVPEGKDCWTSGCQPFDWAQRGCFPDAEWSMAKTFDCPGGNKYRCCAKGSIVVKNEDEDDDRRVSTAVVTERPPNRKPTTDSPRRGRPDPPPSAEESTNDEGLSFKQFSDALTLNRYPQPSEQQYNTMMDYAYSIGGISSIKELAMFVSHVIVNSDGLRARKEACGRSCKSKYKSSCDRQGQMYYGRGYMHLKWCYNYQEASEDLYGDERLLEKPNFVEDDEEAAWATALWFWKRSVRTKPGVLDGMFGSSTHRIHRDECRGRDNARARSRFMVYTKVLVAFGQGNVAPDEKGCYN